ncbi:hypothetical protein ABZT08_23385 [Streptomyces sp. NPDC005526]|uniref:hypothetical protein n=1 Tax=Streptomyces sp. NPDC005526 TaxID=3156885 RepID=UPI0033B237C0
MAHVRSMVWGPAEFVGLPPRRLLVEGILAGFLAAGAIVGTTVAGVWTGRPSLANGEAGLACAVALVLYLLLVRAGRALVGIVAVIAACLALQAPQAAAGVLLSAEGRVQPVVVTSVEAGRAAGGGRDRYLCSVVDADGAPLTVRIWRGCGRATRPGDALAVLYDPKGRVAPRGLGVGTTPTGPLRDLAPWVLALVAGSTVAVVRSFRLSSPSESAGR